MFWQWYDAGQVAPAEEGGSSNGLFGIYDTDSVFGIIQSFSASLKALAGQALPSCAASAPAPGAAQDCSRTRVGGQPGTGYEGPSCTVSINECARQTDRCDAAAACVDSPAGYSCACFPGYAGDGFTCAATPGLTAIQGRYATRGAAQLACTEGADVPYPAAAPGWAYDPTGGLQRAAAGGGAAADTGSRAPVSPQGCMQACELAPGCDSFSYNPEQRKCFLKHAAGASQDVCQVRCPLVCRAAQNRETPGRETGRGAWRAGHGGCYRPLPWVFNGYSSIPMLQRPLQAMETVCISARSQPYSCGTWQTYFRSEGPSPGAPGAPAGATQLVDSGASPVSAGAAPPSAPAAGGPNPALQSGATVDLIEAFQGQAGG